MQGIRELVTCGVAKAGRWSSHGVTVRDHSTD
jgi:hypothetical protein